MMDLDKHKFFEYQSKQYVVPLEIAKKALKEAKNKDINISDYF
ncbi:hypothetical protein N9Z86_00430 [bacterium]|nr:hypothetical protein [bacterium]